MATHLASRRTELLRRSSALAILTIVWNVVEAVVALTAAVLSGSLALLGFGVGSLVESSQRRL
jgi:divalent metal cation (Fe/Co/Zn/Cd) transporter